VIGTRGDDAGSARAARGRVALNILATHPSIRYAVPNPWRARMNHARLLAFVAAGSFLLSSATALAQTDPKKVERAWKAKCSSCHGAAGKGDTEKGQQMKIADMTSAEFQAKKDDEFKNAINNGVKKEKGGVKQEMDAFKGDLTPEQIDALVAYIRTFKK
jgi:mono/diheme cytochrome c family protein